MERFVSIYGQNLYFDDSGKGKVVVLLHGYLESKVIWSELARELSQDYRIICPDLPGHGKSDLTEPIATMELLARRVKELLDILQVDRCVMLGHSMGGYVALAFAELFPAYLSGFGLVHSHPFADSDEKRAARLNDVELILSGLKEAIIEMSIPRLFANDNVSRMKGTVERWKQMARSTANSGIIASLRGMAARTDRSNILENLYVPGLLVFGRKDNLIPNEVALRVEHAHSHLRTVWLENSGHLGFVEEPYEMRLAISSFLNDMAPLA